MASPASFFTPRFDNDLIRVTISYASLFRWRMSSTISSLLRRRRTNKSELPILLTTLLTTSNNSVPLLRKQNCHEFRHDCFTSRTVPRFGLHTANAQAREIFYVIRPCIIAQGGVENCFDISRQVIFVMDAVQFPSFLF